jgi:hypothetical protein
MTRIFLVLLSLLMLQACNARNEASAIEELNIKNPVWVFAHFNVSSEKKGLDSYYYFGQVNESLYNKIANNKLNSGFILMRNVRFWNDNNTIEAYSDPIDGNNLLFRIEDIRRIRRTKTEPVVGYKYEEEPESQAPEGPKKS